jgi:hypothetical protein
MEIKYNIMRTKRVLLSTAVCLLGGVTAQAQSVYSVNAVGYVNVNIPANAYVQIANPLDANPLDTNSNTLGALLTSVPEFTSIYKYNGSGYEIATFFGGAWDKPETTMNPGEGAFINGPEAFTITFVGTVLQGTNTISLPAGYSLVGSKIPQSTDVSVLGLTQAMKEFDAVYIYNGSGYDIYTYFGGAWDPSVPQIEVGHSVFVNVGAPATWTRVFDINNPNK